MPGLWCGGAAGGSQEASWGGATLVFSWIPVLLETCGPTGVTILQAGRAGAPSPCFLCSLVVGALSAGHWGSNGWRSLMAERSWAEMGCD